MLKSVFYLSIMSELRKANTDETYFLTFTIEGWIDIFTRSCYCDIIIDSLIFSQKNKSLEIYAYVIMSNHVHLVVRRTEGLLSAWIHDFKSFTAKEILKEIANNKAESRKKWLIYMFKYFTNGLRQNKEHAVWQKTSRPVVLFNSYMMDQKVEYIHQNPVVAGIVTEAEYYTYSSANIFSRLKTDEM